MIDIAIVDDHAIARYALRELFSCHLDLRVRGEAANAREAVNLARTAPLDVMVLDICMPGPSGVDTLSMVRAHAPSVAVLIFSGQPEEVYAPNLLQAGAAGYLPKDCDASAVVDAVRTVATGRRFVSRFIAARLKSREPVEEPMWVHTRLSPAEFRVFLGLAKGLTVTAVGNSLGVSMQTASTHRTHVLEKMGLNTNADLTRYAVSNRLIA